MGNYSKDRLALVSQGIVGHRSWHYTDTGTIATIVADGFITDGYDMGMRVGDPVQVYDSTLGVTYQTRVSVAQDTGASQVTLDGQVVVSDTS